mgnify:CR=1
MMTHLCNEQLHFHGALHCQHHSTRTQERRPRGSTLCLLLLLLLGVRLLLLLLLLLLLCLLLERLLAAPCKHAPHGADLASTDETACIARMTQQCVGINYVGLA